MEAGHKMTALHTSRGWGAAAQKFMNTNKLVSNITTAIAGNFRCFGAGSTPCAGNPIAHALAEKPAQFAAGVDVAEVVRFVLAQARIEQKAN